MHSEEKKISLLKYFQNKRWEIMGERGNVFPDDFATSTLANKQFKVFLDAQLKDNFISKKSSVTKQTINLTVRMFSERPYQLTAGNVSADKIPLAFIKENGYLDIRKQGGGLSKDYIENNLEKDIALHSLTDVGRYGGVPTGAGTSLIIELPSFIYEDLGKEKVLSIIHKYLAGGIYPCLREYNADRSILGV